VERATQPVWPVFLAWVAATVITLGGSVLVVVAALAVALAREGPRGIDRLAQEVATLPVVVVGSVLVSSTTLAVVALVGAKLERRRIADRLHLRFGGRDAALVIPGVMLVLGFGQVLDSLAHLLGLMELSALAEFGEMVHRTSFGWFAALLVVASIGPGIGEELFFRGYAQTRLTERWGRWSGIVVASVLFGLLHMDLLHTPMAFAIGVALGWLAERAGSIVPGIAVHVVNNAVSFLLLRFLDPAGMTDATHALLAGAGFLVGLGGVAAVLVLTRYGSTEDHSRGPC